MKPYFAIEDVTIWHGDAREAAPWLPEDSVDAIMTSPPYFGLRDYGVEGQLGLEDTPEDYVTDLADTLTSYVGVLKDGGSLWLNLGDTYNSGGRGHSAGGAGATADVGATQHNIQGRMGVEALPAKCLLMIPERVALAMIDRGWTLRNKVIWHKPNGMPESVKDRCATKWEYVFHLVRQRDYYYDLDAIREPYAAASLDRYEYAFKGDPDTVYGSGRVDRDPRDPGTFNPQGKNPGDVWSLPTKPYPEAHFAVYPPELCDRPIKATVPEDGIVLDPFFGAGMTAVMARKLGRRCWGVELNEDYCDLAADRFTQGVLL